MTDVLAGRFALVAYQRPGGAAAFVEVGIRVDADVAGGASGGRRKR